VLAKVLLLGSLYLAQGLPYGFFTQALPILLREHGLSLPLIGLANLLALPWALKFAWAPLVDRVRSPRGRRRAVIVPLQLASAVALGALAVAASPDAMWLLCIAVLVVNTLAATQDIATDALAVEILSPAERGLGNGLQVGAYRIGMVIGGGAMLLVFAYAGWAAAFLGLGAILAITTIPIMVFREPAPAAPTPAGKSSLASIRESLARPGMWPWIAVLMTYKTGEWFANGMLRTFLKDSKQSIDDIALMLGFIGFSAAVVGALAGGTWTVKLGRRTALIAFGAMQTLAIGSFALAALMPSTAMFYAVTVAEHLTSAMATAALFTAMMDVSRATSAGTDYTVQASIVVVFTGISAALSGVSAHALGYAGHFALAAAISAFAVLVAWRIQWPGVARPGPDPNP
jgi:MFS transporter, PAT family, beta-lactamase induction signal transducer AmpG